MAMAEEEEANAVVDLFAVEEEKNDGGGSNYDVVVLRPGDFNRDLIGGILRLLSTEKFSTFIWRQRHDRCRRLASALSCRGIFLRLQSNAWFDALCGNYEYRNCWLKRIQWFSASTFHFATCFDVSRGVVVAQNYDNIIFSDYNV